MRQQVCEGRSATGACVWGAHVGVCMLMKGRRLSPGGDGERGQAGTGSCPEWRWTRGEGGRVLRAEVI